jgi:hypothetical protein
MNEREIDKVLGLASTPELPQGAAARLMARIAAEKQQVLVIPLAPRLPVRRSPLRYAAALPLAASLALGVYLGAKGSLDFMLPTVITGVQADEVLDELGGVGEAEDYAGESLS